MAAMRVANKCSAGTQGQVAEWIRFVVMEHSHGAFLCGLSPLSIGGLMDERIAPARWVEHAAQQPLLATCSDDAKTRFWASVETSREKD